MSGISIKELQDWSREGLIPGPDETEEEFRLRAAYCMNLRRILPEAAAVDEPFQRQLLEEASPITLSLYNMAPNWVPMLFSNDKLSLWQGGCAWIFRMDEHTPTGAFFQLRLALRRSSHFLRIYSRKELIAHELCHVGRMAFEEPKFEELIAYRTAHGWRRWLGPIVQSSVESMIFVLSLLFVLLADIFVIFVDPSAAAIAIWMKLLPIALILIAGIRLWRRQRVFDRCLELLRKVRAEGAVLWLTDEEIIEISQKTFNEFNQYIQDKSSFRWDCLKKLYPIS